MKVAVGMEEVERMKRNKTPHLLFISYSSSADQCFFLALHSSEELRLNQ